LNKDFSLSDENKNYINSQLRISYKTIQHHVKTWWSHFGQPLSDELLSKLKSNSGHILKGDHTYKIVKSLSAFSTIKKTWVILQYLNLLDCSQSISLYYIQ
jgi:hypothetical protein